MRGKIMTEAKTFFVYIMTNKRNGTLYVGVTSDLFQRVFEHKNSLQDGFTKKYGIKRLVYFEEAGDSYEAITREKQLKKWNRKWKLRLIEEFNPDWNDLYDEIL
jgi:putative endonuclease